MASSVCGQLSNINSFCLLPHTTLLFITKKCFFRGSTTLLFISINVRQHSCSSGLMFDNTLRRQDIYGRTRVQLQVEVELAAQTTCTCTSTSISSRMLWFCAHGLRFRATIIFWDFVTTLLFAHVEPWQHFNSRVHVEDNTRAARFDARIRVWYGVWRKLLKVLWWFID